ncbi:aldehyde dehydrogenase family protein [Mycoplasma marinum]|uniref:NADP-dependent glyceraldehyde-3-phosphate dehydrogenase n=1 Tax=Mycoplasma marinum TaxID=1937190 RepID=A0A4R0XJ38_9MOLU|nr:aldehyde dehydrogenase family protein [Mycoplasma marinum]TCG10636.1 NADP-dependent glyceraldehyde-3-phosphate dehydrogenase [Mycoplasma marinum]
MEARAYINGVFVIGKKRYSIISPNTLEECGTATALSKKGIDQAFEVAKNSQKEWASLPREERIDYIETFKQLLIENKEELAKIMLLEIGKPFQQSIKEIDRTVALINETIFAYHNILVKTIKGSTLGVPEKMISIIREPLGVVTAISPFNYPVNLSLAKIIPALISGNSVVFKPATNGSLSGYKMARLFDAAKFPAGVFNMVTGRGSEIGDYLTNHKGANAISYTGSTRVGLSISENAKMQNVVLEMGGKDPALVLKDANLDSTIDNIIKGAFSFAGQRCTAIKRVFVHESKKKEFELGIKTKVASIPSGTSDSDVMVVPLITEASAKFQRKLINDAVKKGAKILIGGNINKNFVEPTVLVNVDETMLIAYEEQFGPVLPIIYYSDLNDAIRQINESEYGLQSSVYGNDIEDAVEAANQIEAGSVNINCAPSRGPDRLPFTGVKNSGFGVQGIKYALESMTRPKNLVIFKSKKKRFRK